DIYSFSQYIRIIFFFFSSRRRHTRSKRDWSSDVCSSDLRSGRCAAASPAVYRRLVYMAFLNRPPCNKPRRGIDGEVVALDAKTRSEERRVGKEGRARWGA